MQPGGQGLHQSNGGHSSEIKKWTQTHADIY